METKEINPKDIVGSGKLPLHLVPGSLRVFAALGFLEGALKYGKYNWRVADVKMSVYLDALERHYEKVKNGEWADEETGVPHLASIIACAGIILDAHVNGTLIDDRPPAAPVSQLIDLLSGEVERLKHVFKDHHPKQYTIEDTDWERFNANAGVDKRVLRALPRIEEGEEAARCQEQGAAGSGERGEGPQGRREGSGSQSSPLERGLER